MLAGAQPTFGSVDSHGTHLLDAAWIVAGTGVVVVDGGGTDGDESNK